MDSSKRDTRKDIILDGYLGIFSTVKAPMKITEKNSTLTAEITNYPKFTVESIGKDLFESKRADLNFNSMKIKRHLK
jgi:hypothetical protein